MSQNEQELSSVKHKTSTICLEAGMELIAPEDGLYFVSFSPGGKVFVNGKLAYEYTKLYASDMATECNVQLSLKKGDRVKIEGPVFNDYLQKMPS